MRPKSLRNLSKVFMKQVFQHIRHGDRGHQKWLREKCVELEGEFAQFVSINTAPRGKGDR